MANTVTPHYQDELCTLYHGDCLEVMRSMPENSVDAIVTDPPYGLAPSKKAKAGFMGKAWDAVVPGVEVWQEALRVLKPGGHALIFGGTRTFHRLVCAVEDAGFEIRDTLLHLHSQGFPKSLNVSKQMDHMAGVEREVIGKSATCIGPSMSKDRIGAMDVQGNNWESANIITAPATDAAKQWDGWGTALKPSYEPICLARKPLSEPTVAANVLLHGTGAINVDACRVPMASNDKGGHYTHKREIGGNGIYGGGGREEVDHGSNNPAGARWPSNVTHDGSWEVLEAFARFGEKPVRVNGGNSTIRHQGPAMDLRTKMRSTVAYGDTGMAARFFPCLPIDDPETLRFIYARKANKRDRAGSKHPTIKPQSLLIWLSKLITPPGGVILDPFAGSGSIIPAAIGCGFKVIAIEKEAEYIADCQRRAEMLQAAPKDPQVLLNLQENVA